ncbi:MAG: glycosyltransferase family 39 protein [Elusimicrobia bacterium]|nr:glycosyltransferase family 39 protein [Elusimicrobiota bacterium]
MSERAVERGFLWWAAALSASTLAFAPLAYRLWFGAWPSPWGQAFARWDAENYLLVAKDGYPTAGPKAFTITLPPLYPVLIRAGALVTSSLDASALLWSNLAFALSLALLYRLARLDLPELQARRAPWFLAYFPTAYFLRVGYTESLYLAAALGAFLLARRRRWAGAAGLAFLASCTRVNGFLLAPALAVEAVEAEGARGALRRAWPLLLAPFGLAVQAFNCWLVYEKPLVFFDIQREKFGKALDFPWAGLWGAVAGMRWRPLYDKVMVGAAEAAAGVLLWAFVVWSWRRQRRAYAVYSALTVAQFTFMNFWCSLPRYALCVFPLFLALPELIQDEEHGRLWLGAGALLQTAGLTLFVAGWWAF